MQASLQEMNAMINSGRRGEYEAMDFPHNRKIRREFQIVMRKAWADIQDHPAVIRLMTEQKESEIRRMEIKGKGLSTFQPVLNMYK